MKSPNITAGRLQKATANWLHGVNSVRNPWALPEDQFKWGQNVSIRGGIVQTRPGFSMRLSLPNGNFQGGIFFNANKQAQAASSTVNANGVRVSTPATVYLPNGEVTGDSEVPYLVFAVDGKVYYAPFPLQQPKNWNSFLLEGIKLDPDVKRVNFALATQTAQTSSGGTTVTPAHRMVIVQDGISQPGYWDGADEQGAQSDKMPIGYWMAFSGNRLWVANGNVIAASDLGNPLGWQERTEGTGRGDFSVPRPVTGMQDYIGQNNDARLYVFTDRSTYSLASGILDRAAWVNTANFQNVVYPTVGCIAGKSICFQAGMMWWYSQGGLVSADVAASSYLSSQVLFKDVEMAKAKRLMAPNTSGICSVSFENYLLCSIPYFEPLNSVTMVLDYAPASEWNQTRSPAWAGVWSGIRPIEWASGVVSGQPRVFAFSIDYSCTNDGSFVHVWEAFSENRFDTYLSIRPDGTTTELVQRIYCQMETGLMGDTMDLKQFVYAEVDCTQVAGTVDVRISFRGSKGPYERILQTRILAAEYPYQFQFTEYAQLVANIGFLQTQHRRLVTESVESTVGTGTCESKYLGNVDKAFSLLIEWCGSLGVECLQAFMDPFATKSVGQVSTDETLYCVVGENGYSIDLNLGTPAEELSVPESSHWVSTQTRTVTLPCQSPSTNPSVSATATATVISERSQQDADLQAAQKALDNATLAAKRYRSSNPC